jgi:predicted Zn-dependent peptidase
MQLAARVLSDGKASRLHRALVMEKQVATEVHAIQYPLILGSYFQVDVQGRPGVSAADLEAATWPLLQSLATAPVSADELKRSLRTWQADTLRGLEGLGGFGGKADLFNAYNHYVGDPDYLAKDFTRFEAVTPATLQGAYSGVVRAENRVVVRVSPAPKP